MLNQDPRRKLVLKLRRRVKVSRRFDVAPDPRDPLVEIQTCRECKDVTRIRHDTTPAMAQKMIKYRSDPNGSGVTGTCRKCSRKAAEERYPL